MDFYISLFLDLILIALLIAGILHAVKLSRQLLDLRASRAEMQKFVMDFNGTVLRAEMGISNLKQAARDRGDDLERLLDKGLILKDELQFLVESADQLANRLSETASLATRASIRNNETLPQAKAATPPAQAAKPAQTKTQPAPKAAPASSKPSKTATTAERDLMRALDARKAPAK